MAGILSTSQPIGERFHLQADNAPGLLDALVIDGSAAPAGPVQPFRATYFVDPAFAGVQTGSMSNPFSTVAAAFAFAASLGITAAVIFTPPNATINENIVFPTSGEFELACISSRLGQLNANASINGTITLTNTGLALHSLTGLNVVGAVSGNAGATARYLFTRCQLASLALTNTAGTLRVFFTGDGPGLSGINSIVTGACSVAGTVTARGTNFNGLVTVGLVSEFNTCILTVGLTATATLTVRCIDTQSNAGAVFTAAAGTLTLACGPATISGLMITNPVLVGSVLLVPLAADASFRVVAAANIGLGALPFMNTYPPSMATARASLQLLTPGTAGAAVLSVGYVDLLGVAQVRAVTPALNIAGAAGSDVQGVFVFQRSAASVTFSVSGIVTPGPLSYSAAIDVQMGV